MAVARSLSIVVNNSSAVALQIVSYLLRDGEWVDGARPQVGSILPSDSEGRYVNGAETRFKGVGGSIMLQPDRGGTIDISWSFAPAAAPSGSVTGAGLEGISLSYALVAPQTEHPQLQVQVLNAPG